MTQLYVEKSYIFVYINFFFNVWKLPHQNPKNGEKRKGTGYGMWGMVRWNRRFNSDILVFKKNVFVHYLENQN